MAYIVTDKCVDCVYTSCVDVCPVEAFHEAPDCLYINPDSCIDCDACVPECPVEAIYRDADLPDELESWVAKNEEAEKFPQIFASKDPKLGPKCVDPNAGWLRAWVQIIAFSKSINGAGF